MFKITWVDIAQKFTLIVLLLAIWGIAYAIFGDAVGYKSETVMLGVLFVGAKVVGYLVSLLKCPAILGQMFFGILLTNIGYFELTGSFLQLSILLRTVALVNIMLPAGLNLDPEVLRNHGIMAILLATMPALIEVLVMGVFAFVALKIHFDWAILMGLILAAVSPSVIFPCLFELENNGYGLEKGVNTLVVAASTLNDILSIAFYMAHLSIIFSTGDLTQQLLKGPIGFVIGIAFGIFWGYLARLIPDKSDRFVIPLRTLLIGTGSLFVCLGADAIHYPSAGVLGCIISAFVASLKYRREGWIGLNNPLKNNFIILWKFFEPISFGLIGVAVKLHLLKGMIILWLLIISMVALLARVVVAYGLGYLGKFTTKERLFFAICAIPKATVQAALGPIPLDKSKTPEEVENSNNVLVLSVLSIMITAPVGAWLILNFGPKLLPKTKMDNVSMTEHQVDSRSKPEE